MIKHSVHNLDLDASWKLVTLYAQYIYHINFFIYNYDSYSNCQHSFN